MSNSGFSQKEKLNLCLVYVIIKNLLNSLNFSMPDFFGQSLYKDSFFCNTSAKGAFFSEFYLSG